MCVRAYVYIVIVKVLFVVTKSLQVITKRLDSSFALFLNCSNVAFKLLHAQYINIRHTCGVFIHFTNLCKRGAVCVQGFFFIKHLLTTRQLQDHTIE